MPIYIFSEACSCFILCYNYPHYLSSKLKKKVLLFYIQHIEPYGANPISGQKEPNDQKSNSGFKNSLGSKSIGAGLMTSNLQSMSPDYETKEIKNIYVDSKSLSSALQGAVVLIFFMIGSELLPYFKY